MEVSTILAIIAALGGFESVKWFLNRKYEKKKASLELKHSREEWLEIRLSERDAKVDTIYRDLRKSEERVLALTKEVNRKELDLELLKIKRCDVRGCTQRQPPSEY